MHPVFEYEMFLTPTITAPAFHSIAAMLYEFLPAALLSMLIHFVDDW